MYDFLIRLNSESQEYNPYSNKYFFERNDIDEISIDNVWLKLQGLAHNLKESYHCENNETIFVVGNIFLREGYSTTSQNIVALKELLADSKHSEIVYKKYKGNYCVIVLNEKSRTLKVINSQLGLNHIYYYFKSNVLYLSNNLNHFKNLNLNYNITAIHQKLLFTYSLTEDTYFNDVKSINPGEVLILKNGSATKSILYNLKNIFTNLHYEKFSLEKYIYLFNNSVSGKANNHKDINVSFTGGFDGRTIISSLINQDIKFNSYSFGKYDGENTRIPLNISNKIGINYKPIYLEEDYEKNYVDDAKRVIYFSDGLSYNERANYIYSFRQLSKLSNYVLSGLIGGETLRPLHLRTDYMNENYYQIFYLNNKKVLDDYLSLSDKRKYINSIDSESLKELNEIIKAKQTDLSEFRKNDYGFLYYLYDLMNTGFRMYYGTEIHFERQFCNNLTPYYDLDLLEYLFSTDYVEVFKNAFKSGKVHRWRGQKIYSQIINKNCKILNNFPVDRGYSPGYLLNPFKLILVPFLYYKRKRQRVNFIDFNESKWSRLFLQDFMMMDYRNDSVFDGKNIRNTVEKNLKSGIYSSELNRILSLYTWLNI